MDEPAKEIQGRKREREEGATEGLPEGSLPAKRFRLQSPSSPMEQPERERLSLNDRVSAVRSMLYNNHMATCMPNNKFRRLSRQQPGASNRNI